jgi:hypothetical protein
VQQNINGKNDIKIKLRTIHGRPISRFCRS